MSGDFHAGAIPTVKQIVEDENEVRKHMPHGAADAAHAKMLLDAFDHLRKDVSAVPAKDANAVFGEVYSDDKLRGQKTLIEVNGSQSGLGLTNDAFSTEFTIGRQFDKALAMMKFNDALAQKHEGSIADLVTQDAKRIADVDATNRLDSTVVHLQMATAAGGSDAAVAYVNLVNDQLARLEQQKQNVLKFRVDGPMYNTCACDETKRGEYGTIWPMLNGCRLEPVKY